MKTILLCCCTLLLLRPSESLAQELFYADKVECSFFSEARFENIEALSKKGASAINIATNEIAFKLAIQSFVFDKGLMQEHFNENYMESDKFPYATFKGKILEDINLKQQGTYKVTVTGLLNIHGITKERTVTGVITVKKDQILIYAAFIVPVADHEIRIPNDKLSNISQDIQVKLSAQYEPKN